MTCYRHHGIIRSLLYMSDLSNRKPLFNDLWSMYMYHKFPQSCYVIVSGYHVHHVSHISNHTVTLCIIDIID